MIFRMSTEPGLSASDEQQFIALCKAYGSVRTVVERSPSEITFLIHFDDVQKAARLRQTLET
jgi:hypothetical protein